MIALRRKNLLVALMAAAALAAGCDDDDGGALSDEEYTKQVQAILTTFADESTRLGAVMQQASTAEEFEAPVADLHDVVEGNVDDLEAIDPPEEAAEGHEAMTSAMTDYEGNIADLLEVVEGGETAAIRTAVAEFGDQAGPSQTAISEAREQLETAGFEVGVPAQ
jgi:hypothetical protein